jgi:signal transduction histidine kinase
LPDRAPQDHEPLPQAETLRLRQRFELLLSEVLAIASEHSIELLLQKVADAARAVVGARYAALGVIDQAGTALSHFIVSGLSEAERQRIGALPHGRGILGVLIREGHPLRLKRLSDDPRSHGFPPNHPPMHSFLGVPIVARGRVFGNLYLTEKVGADEFSEEDESIAVLLAAQAAAAIDNAQLLARQEALLAERQALQRQRDQFFAMINHELRNALTGVYGWAEQLQRSKTEEGAQRAGREIFESAERTITLMNNLLDLSRLDASSVQLVLGDHRIAELVAAAVRLVQPAAEAKGVIISSESGNAPDMVTTDRLKLEQVLVNLLSNAVRHSPHAGQIVVSRSATPDEVLISVSDQGAGVAEADQHKIFEPFVRVDPESGLGSGLGLPVARRLTELMGGRLTVHSHVGRGATFTVSLPRSPHR